MAWRGVTWPARALRRRGGAGSGHGTPRASPSQCGEFRFRSSPMASLGLDALDLAALPPRREPSDAAHRPVTLR